MYQFNSPTKDAMHVQETSDQLEALKKELERARTNDEQQAKDLTQAAEVANVNILHYLVNSSCSAIFDQRVCLRYVINWLMSHLLKLETLEIL